MSKVTLIKIQDTGRDYYTLDPSELVLGRRYDNGADLIEIDIPSGESDHACVMIVTDINGKVIDHIRFDSNTKPIRNNISQYESVKIGFYFMGANGYVKGSEIKTFTFLKAQKPSGFVPVDPEQNENVDYLIQYGFTNSELVGNTLVFYNMNGDIVREFDFSPFTQEQSDLAESDNTKETFVKNKSTKYLENEGSDGTDTYAEMGDLNEKVGDLQEDLTDGTITVKKAESDSEGNVISSTYMPKVTKYGASLSVSGTTVKLKDQNGDDLGSAITTQDTGATSVGVKSGDSGNVVTNITYDSETRKMTVEKGITALTQHQDISGKLDKKPDGTNDLISNNKITTRYLPDFLLGQVLYGGNVGNGAVATLSANAKSKLGTSSTTIALTNDTSAITGYEANDGIYYIATTDFSFAGLTILTGDWLISRGNAWDKIDNTDAVTGVKGNAESVYRTGNVNITPDNLDDTSTTNKFVTSTEKNTWNGKQDAISSSNKLSADLVDDSSATNKFVTAGDKTTWSGKQDAIDSSHKLSADLVDDTSATNKFTNTTEKSTWNGKQDALVSGTNIKTINSQSILGSGDLTIQGGVTDVQMGGQSIVTNTVANIPTESATAIPIDATPTQNSDNLVTSGGVYSAIQSAITTTLNTPV